MTAAPVAAPGTTPAIEACGLTRRFGDVLAVDGVDLRIEPGAVFGLLGPDGAGKSTLIRMLATVLRPDAGDASVHGFSVTRKPGKVTPRIGYMSQKFALYPDLSVEENIEFFATLRGVPAAGRRERMIELLRGMGLADFLDRQAGRLSGGMKQKLFLAVTLMHAPDVLLLDEPTTGVDPVSRREFWRILAGLHRQGTTVLVATPYMDEAERCTDVAFLDGGRVRHRGTPAEIKALVPGVLFEVRAADPRAALAALESLPGLLAVHLYGDVVRVLTRADDPDAVRAVAGPDADVRRAPVDMETTFAFLAELGRGAESTVERPVVELVETRVSTSSTSGAQGGVSTSSTSGAQGGVSTSSTSGGSGGVSTSSTSGAQGGVSTGPTSGGSGGVSTSGEADDA